MRPLLRLLPMLILVLYFFGCGSDTDQSRKLGADNVAFLWADAALDAVARDTDRYGPRPTITSRYLAMIFCSVYDAWSRFDPQANPRILQDVARAPAAEHHDSCKEKAISYAAYHTCCHYFKSDIPHFTELMQRLGYDPDLQSKDAALAEGIGHLSALAVISHGLADGSNEDGSLTPENPIPYLDYTGYRPVNHPDSLLEFGRWQPKYFTKPTGERFAPGCLTAQWPKVSPLMLVSAGMHRAPAPPEMDSEKLLREVSEVIELQAKLTDEQMALVEFMRDGPSSVQQAGHWLIFSQHVSKRDRHSLDDDVKMFFLLTAAAMDAFIACWETKMHYDYARPFALVHHYYAGSSISGWTGRGRQFAEMDGAQWRPYSPDAFLCPAFPAYVSGHSTVSGACAEVLKLYKGNDRFDHSVELIAGALTDPTDPGQNIRLIFPTFTDAAERAGFSRVLGGYHIQSDNIEGLALGRRVGQTVFNRYQNLIEPK